MKEEQKTDAAKKMEETDAPLPSIGATSEKDDLLTAEGTPLGTAAEVNKEKKVEGPNRPST